MTLITSIDDERLHTWELAVIDEKFRKEYDIHSVVGMLTRSLRLALTERDELRTINKVSLEKIEELCGANGRMRKALEWAYEQPVAEWVGDDELIDDWTSFKEQLKRRAEGGKE